MLTLYTFFRSSASFRVRIALNYKGLPWDPKVIWLPEGEQLKDEFRQVNTQGLVPALVDNERPGGPALLAQSLAIIEYLDETRPERPLLPRDPLGRARVRSLSQLIACEIHPLNNLRVLKHLKKAYGFDEEKVNGWYRHWIAEGLSAFERELTLLPVGLPAAAVPGDFLVGNTPTMADCCLVPQIFNAKRYDCDLSPYPKTMAVFDRCMKLPAFDLAQPAKQAEAARAS